MLMQAKQSIYSPTQEGLIFPQEPVFSSIAEERQYRKEHLAAGCRMFARHGFSFGFGGHRGCGQKLGLVYAASPRLSRYSSGLSEPRETLIRFSLYQRMYASTTSMNCSMVVACQSRE
jgi:hypothetical protein